MIFLFPTAVYFFHTVFPLVKYYFYHLRASVSTIFKQNELLFNPFSASLMDLLLEELIFQKTNQSQDDMKFGMGYLYEAPLQKS